MSNQPRRPDERPRSVNPQDWPRLTKTLPPEHNRPGCCRACGFVPNENTKPADELQLWQEHDHHDKPEPSWFWLCPKCAEKLIEPHVRLYSNPHKWAPAPGAMDICAPCLERTGCLCSNRAAKSNGGPGINITVGKPMVGFWDGVDKKGRRTGGRFMDFPSPPSKCSGFVSHFSGTPPQPAATPEPKPTSENGSQK